MRTNYRSMLYPLPTSYYSDMVGTNFKQEPNPKKFGSFKNQQKQRRRGGRKRG